VFLPAACVDGSFEAVAASSGFIAHGPSQANNKARTYTQIVCIDRGPWL